MLDFNDQVIIVTGSGSAKGIGKTIALEFAAQGGKVVIADLNDEGVKSVVKEITDAGGQAMGVKLNVTDKASNDDMVKQVLDKWGRLDVLVNNAGISQKKTVRDMTLDDIKRIFEVNVYGLILCTQSCMEPMLKAGYGRIVNLSSVSAKRGGGVFGGAHYSASKAAVLAFAKNLSREISMNGITINSVCPGLIDTEIWKSLDKEDADKVIAGIPMGRPGQTKEVAAAILFLASREASYITGEEIDINGGSHMD